MAGTYRRRPPRTVLEQRLREWRVAQHEFIEYAERFAREHGKPATLGLRHLQRLVAGHATKGTRLGPLLPETARLLERIFDISADKLLSAPEPGDEEAERERIHRTRRVNPQTLDLLYDQLAGMRRADRQLGVTVHDDVRVKLKSSSRTAPPQCRTGHPCQVSQARLRARHARGLAGTRYRQFTKHGDTTSKPKPPPAT